MNTRTIGIITLTMTLTLASANLSGPQIFEGRGRAESRGAGVAEFAGRIAQRQGGQIEGSFTFNAETRNPDRNVRINLRQANRFDVTGHVAKFTGPGRLIVRFDNTERTHDGTVIIEATDRRNPQRPGQEPDLLKVRFESRTLPGGYHFEGVVHRGDIFVGERAR